MTDELALSLFHAFTLLSVFALQLLTAAQPARTSCGLTPLERLLTWCRGSWLREQCKALPSAAASTAAKEAYSTHLVLNLAEAVRIVPLQLPIGLMILTGLLTATTVSGVKLVIISAVVSTILVIDLAVLLWHPIRPPRATDVHFIARTIEVIGVCEPGIGAPTPRRPLQPLPQQPLLRALGNLRAEVRRMSKRQWLRSDVTAAVTAHGWQPSQLESTSGRPWL